MYGRSQVTILSECSFNFGVHFQDRTGPQSAFPRKRDLACASYGLARRLLCSIDSCRVQGSW